MEDPKKPQPNRPGNGAPGNGDGNKGRTFVLYALIACVFIAIISTQFWGMGTGQQQEVDTITTSQFVSAVSEDRVTEVTYHASKATLEGVYYVSAEDAAANQNARAFTSTYVGDDSLQELMAAHPNTKYNVDVTTNSMLMTLLTTLIPFLLFFGVMVFFLRQMTGATNKQMQFGKTKAKKDAQEVPNVRFADVAGIDEVVDELEEVKDFLDNPAKYQAMGAKIPRGVLLVGPPGTGKTLLAKAVAGEAGVPFFSISGSDFVEMFVGVGASRVRDLFSQAKEAAPSIIFIDEIDAVGRQRGAGMGGGHDEREQTLNQLLVEMDGFEENESVILIAATNRVDILDPALLRPGRFDRQITVQPPDAKGREQILKVHSKGKPLAAAIDLKKVAQLTSGFTGADLANLMNESALLAARRNKRCITSEELNESFERQVAGLQRKGHVPNEKERRCIAYHECGHALVGHLLDNADPIHKITVIGRGQALGYTLSIPEEDKGLQSRNEMIDDMAMLLGGRVAEEIVIGDITTGASNDLERATKMARNMVTVFGMSDKLGHRVYGERQHNPFLGRDYSSTPDYSDTTADLIDAEVTRLMNDAHDTAYRILTENREQLELMAGVLLERETVEGPAVEALLENRWDEYLAAEAAGEVKQNGDLFGFDEDEQAAQEPAAALPEQAGAEQQPAHPRPQAGGPQPPEGY
ncbi:MAG: ATP-dependent zinc metalloprotease FtsH [Coriobacteriales bacterium]